MTPPTLIRAVEMTFPSANQAVAALEDRIAHLRLIGSEPWAIAHCHAALACLRTAFDLWPSEAQLDAAHEASVAEMRELADAALPDVPLADTTSPQLLQYQAEGR